MRSMYSVRVYAHDWTLRLAHLAAGEHVGNIFQEAFLHNLRVLRLQGFRNTLFEGERPTN